MAGDAGDHVRIAGIDLADAERRLFAVPVAAQGPRFGLVRIVAQRLLERELGLVAAAVVGQLPRQQQVRARQSRVDLDRAPQRRLGGVRIGHQFGPHQPGWRMRRAHLQHAVDGLAGLVQPPHRLQHTRALPVQRRLLGMLGEQALDQFQGDLDIPIAELPRKTLHPLARTRLIHRCAPVAMETG
ncbi:MAG: hypothetical protein OMOMHJEC_02226 [Xanthomonadales bacterium]|nr:hypothetical protein [Xanthomonadales bacterium]